MLNDTSSAASMAYHLSIIESLNLLIKLYMGSHPIVPHQEVRESSPGIIILKPRNWVSELLYDLMELVELSKPIKSNFIKEAKKETS